LTFRELASESGQRRPERRSRLLGAAPATTAAVLALACTVTGLAVDRFDPAHPAPAQLMYALDAGTGQAWWVTADADPGEWTRQYVDGPKELADFPVLGEGLLVGPATAASLPAPAVETVSDSTSGDRRTLTLRVRPQRTVRLAYVAVDGGVVSATVEGRQVATRDGRLGILFHAPPPDGIEVTLVLNRTGTVSVRVMDGSDGLTGLPGFTPRPSGLGIEGTHASELVLVARTYQIP
jgi:hypothetical protein